MKRGENQRQARQRQLAQQATRSAEAIRQARQQSQQIAAGGSPLAPTVYARTTRFNSEGFTEEQIRSITAPRGSQRVQFVISQPGYRESGVRSTGWIDVTQIDLSTLEQDFGIKLGDLRSVVFDNA